MRPNLTLDNVESEREMILEEYAQTRSAQNFDNPFHRLDIFTENQNETISRPVIGTESTIKKMNLEHIQEFHRKNYTPGNLVLVYCGSGLNHEELCGMVEKSFPWNTAEGLADSRKPFVPLRKHMTSSGLMQTIGVIGPEITSSDYLAFSIGIKMLQKSRKQTFNIRSVNLKERQIVLIDIHRSVLSKYKNVDSFLRHIIEATISQTGTPGDNTSIQSTFDSVKNEMVKHQKGHPKKDELYFTGEGDVLTSSTVAKSVGEDFLRFGRRIEGFEMRERLDEVSLEDAEGVLRHWLVEGNYSAVCDRKMVDKDNFEVVGRVKGDFVNKIKFWK